MKSTAVLEEFGKCLGNLPEELIDRAAIENPWFTADNIRKSRQEWQNQLSTEAIVEWIAMEQISGQECYGSEIGIICAGNIPFVGLHDVLCAAMVGAGAQVKLSNDDKVLMNWVLEQLNEIIGETRLKAVEKLVKPDAVIATGSNNSARYFEYYFEKYPHIIRKNRNSAAVLTGNETSAQIRTLGNDIFSYFGLGCRNVTHLFVPRGFDYVNFYEAIEPFADLINHNRYANNYTYHRALMLMNGDKFLDNGFLLLREHAQLYSPLAVLHYSFYETIEALSSYLIENQGLLQCVATEGSLPISSQVVRYGQTQSPALWDYADGINTVQFLKSLSKNL